MRHDRHLEEPPEHPEDCGCRECKTEATCQFACDHNCTLVGHAYEALHFLNQCMDHAIVKSAVEGDPAFRMFEDELNLTKKLLELRSKK